MEMSSRPLRRHVTAGVAWHSFVTPEPIDGLLTAISTRHGGVSEGGFASLNLSHGVGDDPLRVDENRRRWHRAVGVAAHATASVVQVHGNRILVVDALPTDRGNAPVVGEADGLVTTRPGVALCLRFADCVPILAWDERHRAIGIAHAGWRGTLAGVARELVMTMTTAQGCRAKEIWAAVGPSIGPCCYEVGADLVATFAETWRDLPNLTAWRGAGWHLDLWEANRQQLVHAGVPEDQVVVARVCTACHSDEFFSHRAQGGKAGRFAALIALTRET